MSQSPISIHIPPQLQRYAIPLSKFLEQNPEYAALAIGATIFSPTRLSSPVAPRLLLVQRAAAEKGFPNLWEVPGGAAEVSDPTILHSVAREVFEETGLRLTRFVREIGHGVQFYSGPKETPKRWLKLTFEIEVQEIGSPCSGASHTDLVSDKTYSLSDIPIVLDPKEHQAFQWVGREEVEDATCFLSEGEYGFEMDMTDIAHMKGALKLVAEDQRGLMISAFYEHAKASDRIPKRGMA